jgi:hypothetical protein
LPCHLSFSVNLTPAHILPRLWLQLLLRLFHAELLAPTPTQFLYYSTSLAPPIPTYPYHFISAPEAEIMNVNISLRFLGIILRVLRLEVSVWISGK